MGRQAWALVALALGMARVACGDTAGELLEHYKQASGGVRWDGVTGLRSEGSLTAGGLAGSFTALQDLASGRSVMRYRLGPVEGADGYDGKLAWSQDPGGEVTALDALEAQRRARSQAWLDARAYWYPARLAATYAAPEAREAEGHRYTVVVATPAGGDPVTLWFDPRTHLLVRTEQKQGADRATTVYDDWREVDGLRLPFHTISFLTDAAGRTDARNRSETSATHIALDAALADADFAMPAMTANARILAPGGEVWISLPNARSWLAAAFGREWINWHVPFHITHFTRERLAALLGECGFELVSARQISPALWAAQSLLARLGRGRPDPTALFKKRWLVAGLMLAIRCGLFPVLILGNLLGRGDCLIVKARRT